MSDTLNADLRALGASDPVPSADFLARVLADAEAVQAAHVAPVPRPRRPLLRQMLDALGGWPALGGLVTATAAGVWLGANPPSGLETLAGGLIGPDETAFIIDSSAELALGLGLEAM